MRKASILHVMINVSSQPNNTFTLQFYLIKIRSEKNNNAKLM